MDAFKHQIHNVFKSTAEMVLPVRHDSAFREKGVLTPAEFVVAGDALVQSCPTWSWEGGDPKCAKPFLPPDRQFLVTRNVPCFRRASAIQDGVGNEETILGEDVGGEWVATHATYGGLVAGEHGNEDLPTICGDGVEVEHPGKHVHGVDATLPSDPQDPEQIPDIDDVPDIDDLAIEDEDDDEAVVVGSALDSESGDTDVVRTRTYDLSITYDKYYQTPRFWLVGYNESKQPMPPSKILEDVSEEHARKTITVDPHPNCPTVQAASIHPCRHADVMKKLVSELGQGGHEVLIEHYLVVFVKFIASIIPTIEYDYTMSVGGQ